MPTLAGLVQCRDLRPGQGLDLPIQSRLVALDDEDVAGLLLFDQSAGMLTLGMQRIRRDDRPGQVQTVEQWHEPADLTGKTTVSGQAAASGRSPDEVVNLSGGCGAGQAGWS